MRQGVETKQGGEQKGEPSGLQALYNRRRELKRAVEKIERLIEQEQEKNRLKVTSARQ